MAAGAKQAGSRREAGGSKRESRSAKKSPQEATPDPQEQHLQWFFEGLGRVAELQVVVERKWPPPNVGYLECIPVDGLSPNELLVLVREKYGPGRYRLRPYGRRAKSSATGYLPGAVTVTIAPLGSTSTSPATHEVHAGSGTVIVERPVGGENASVVNQLLALAAKKDGVATEGLYRLLERLLSREKPSNPAYDLDAVVKVAERIAGARKKGGGGGDDEESMERMMLMAILWRIMSPDERRADDRRQQPNPNRGQVRGQVRKPAKPQPQQRPPDRRAPPAATNPEAATTTDDDDDELTLEEEIVEHVSDLAEENPLEAVKWIATEILDKLPHKVKAALAAAFGGGGDDDHDDDDPDPKVVRIPRGERKPDV